MVVSPASEQPIDAPRHPKTAFVLGGGGMLGAHEVGMLRALSETGIAPDLVVGTSVGALNGVVVAADPLSAAERLATLWRSDVLRTAFAGSWVARLSTLARTGTHLHPLGPLRHMLAETLPATRFEELPVRFQCVAASVERACAHWFTEGPLVEAVLASCAVPGLLPPVVIDGEHFFDGGLVHSIPVGRAVGLGARKVYVLHVGRIERPLIPPRTPLEVGMVAFEIARRHRFAEEMASLPDSVEVHVLPSGSALDAQELRKAARRAQNGAGLQLRYRDPAKVGHYIDRAYRATLDYLAAQPGSA